jgi:hypothetical protein
VRRVAGGPRSGEVVVSKLGSWSPLWNEYPDYIFYDSPKVKKMIGGGVDVSWFTNTCAIRLSRTLNYNGFALPRYPGMNTAKGADGKRYAYRIKEMKPWLNKALGKPDFLINKKQGGKFDKKTLWGKKGIIGFDIAFKDATGHLDLWNGLFFSSEHKMTIDYWTNATRIWMWNAK